MLLKWVQEKGKNGQQPPCEIDGTIEVIFKRKTGTGQYGDWSIQGGKINLEDGQIDVTFMGCKELPWTLKGKKITVELKETKRGLAGMKLNVREWVNKDGEKVISRSISIKPSALIKIDGKIENCWENKDSIPVPKKGDPLIETGTQHNKMSEERKELARKQCPEEFKAKEPVFAENNDEDDCPF